MSTHDRPTPRFSYWRHLDLAFERLDAGDFSAAEGEFFCAVQQREGSPGRVFLTEKLGDRLRRMLHRRDPQAEVVEPGGRWERSSEQFKTQFLSRADEVVREALRQAGLRPEDEAEANQPLFERALFLAARSRLFPAEPRSSVPLLKGLLRTACRTGRPFPHHLVRHDLPLTEEERLWLAAKGGDMLDAFIEQENLVPGSIEAQEWARAILQILRREYFGSSDRLESERSWLEAVSADRLLQQPGPCVALYRQFLSHEVQPGPRQDEARLRILEILANVDGLHLPVPRYREALAAVGEDFASADQSMSWRRRQAIECIGHRQPGLTGDPREALAWASFGLESDGSVGVVFWWDDQPRDFATWRPGQDAVDIDDLLAGCGERIVALSPDVTRVIGEQWDHVCGPVCAMGLATAVLESRLPASGLEPEELLPLALAEIGSWRRGWSRSVGHPLLEPPAGTPNWAGWSQRSGNGALLGGLLVLAMRSHLEHSDPSLRAGIRELGRRGDAASWFLYELVALDRPAVLALDGTFAPWTLPLLWTRPGPWPRREGGAVSTALPAYDLQPDLARHDLAIVSTGTPAAVMKAWGESGARWRVVWDRSDRRSALESLAPEVLGPSTLVPPEGRVHDLDAALALLSRLLDGARAGNPEIEGLLGLFHWVRLIETHNGDLNDFVEIRGRTAGEIELYDVYRSEISDLPQQAIEEPGQDGWAAQYRQRARKSGWIGGSWRLLTRQERVLDARWGVFDGSDASWVFVDSAAVHDRLLDGGEVEVLNLHGVLMSRGHRHLSLLLGVAWLPEILGRYLCHLLLPYGRAYRLTLQDRRLPVLKLADRGLRPDSRLQQGQALAAQVLWLRQQAEGSDLTVLLPEEEVLAGFWRAVAQGTLPGVTVPARFADREEILECTTGAGERPSLVLPALPCCPGAAHAGEDEDGCLWMRRDERRLDAMVNGLARSALALAGLLAGPWREVIVLDVRWWHLLWGGGPWGEDRPWDRGSWSFSEACRLADAIDAHPLQLPETGSGRSGRDNPASTVADWLAEHGHVPAAAPADTASGHLAGKGIVLEIGPGAGGWQADADRIEASREQGQLDAWMLMVAAECDPLWRGIVDRDSAPGFSVPGPGDPRHPPAALVWVKPEQLGTRPLKDLLTRMPPAVVHLLDFSSWLPDPGQERHQEAVALRGLLLSESRIVLHAEQIAGPWSGFLAEMLPDRFVAGDPGQMGESSVAPVPVAGSMHQGTQRVRVQRLLEGLRPGLIQERGSDTESGRLVSTHELCSLRWLAWRSGLEMMPVAMTVRTLRWALSVQGIPLPADGVTGDREGAAPPVGVRARGHAVLLENRFAVLEHRLDEVDKALEVLLPLWLQGLGPRMRRWIRLNEPPAEVPAADLVFIDTLLGLNGREPGLVYLAPDGAFHSHRRLVGCDRDPGDILAGLQRKLQRLRLQLGEMLDAAVETPEGFLVETGLQAPAESEQDFLALGAALGLWRWLGPSGARALSLVDLLALSDIAAKPEAAAAWRLCARLLEPDLPERRVPNERGSDPESGSSPLRGLRRIWRGPDRSRRELDRGSSAVSRALAQEGPGLLVLKGTAGSARHAMLARALAEAAATAPFGPDLRVFCPDAAIAAHVAGEFLRFAPDVDYALEVPRPGAVFPHHPGALPASPHAVVILCEAQRFPSDLRYRISQLGRECRLLLTVDPWDSEESWESLFLTTPHPNQVLACNSQQRVADRVWSRIRTLTPRLQELPAGGGSDRPGILTADYAANLDQCLGRLFATPEFNGPNTLLRVVAGVSSDLDYLGGALVARGWTVVDEAKLEPWLPPGPRELLALLLALDSDGSDALAAQLLPAASSLEDWPGWSHRIGPDILEGNLAACWARLRTEDVWRGVLAHDPHRARIAELLGAYGDMACRDFLLEPLVAAARRLMLHTLGNGVPDEARPTALLAKADQRPGLWTEAAMDLCQGSEHPLRHYRHWSRVETGLLILFKERSPLSGGGG